MKYFNEGQRNIPHETERESYWGQNPSEFCLKGDNPKGSE